MADLLAEVVRMRLIMKGSRDEPFPLGIALERINGYAALERQLREAQTDAARYRWLRAQLPGAVDAWNLTRLAAGLTAADNEIDAAIDQALAARNPPGAG